MLLHTQSLQNDRRQSRGRVTVESRDWHVQNSFDCVELLVPVLRCAEILDYLRISGGNPRHPNIWRVMSDRGVGLLGVHGDSASHTGK